MRPSGFTTSEIAVELLDNVIALPTKMCYRPECRRPIRLAIVGLEVVDLDGGAALEPPWQGQGICVRSCESGHCKQTFPAWSELAALGFFAKFFGPQ